MEKRTIFILCTAVLTCWLGPCQSQPGEKWNVLFLVADDMRPSLGCYGDSAARTPNIDKLASMGLLFERAYCQQALCAPSRASVMTGRRPDAVQITSEGTHFRTALPDVVTLPQHFKERGYYTQAFGKVYHALPAQPDPPSWSVPETLLDIPKRDEYLLPENRTRGFINPMEKGSATESVEAPDNAYQDGQVAQAAIETLREIKDKPFFLAVGFKRPHLPFTAPKRYWDMYARESVSVGEDLSPHLCSPDERALRYDWQEASGEMRNYTDVPASGPVPFAKAQELIHGYYACVSYVDAQVGRILRELEDLGLMHKTVIVFWSDHGFHLGEKGLWGKKDNTEMATRVPLLLKVPGYQGGTRTNALVELVDIYPTLVEACGLPMPDGLAGKSMVTLLSGPQTLWKTAAFSQFPRKSHTVMGYSVRTDHFRYNEYRVKNSGDVVDRELYRISDDPYEADNLVHKPIYRREVKQMKQILASAWNLPEHN